MSELKLREFRARAEELVTLPDLTELEHRGRDLHHRRTAAVAAVAACALAVAGFATLRDDPSGSAQPTGKTDQTPVRAHTYPGNTMLDVDAGTYQMAVSYASAAPDVRFTLPRGWNAWEGPNRFNGHAPGRTNEEALAHLTWYVGVLVVEVNSVSTRPCRGPRGSDQVGPTAASLVRAITRIQGYRVAASTEPVAKFGHPATHLRLHETAALADCGVTDNLFGTTRNGVVGGYTDTEDVWVVDVDGHPVLVDAQMTTMTPPAVRRELRDVLDSIEFVNPQ